MTTPENRMIPVTLTMDLDRYSRLKAVSRSTRVSMSELVRVSIDKLMEILGDPENPDPQALAMLLKSGESDERSAGKTNRPGRMKSKNR